MTDNIDYTSFEARVMTIALDDDIAAQALSESDRARIWVDEKQKARFCKNSCPVSTKNSLLGCNGRPEKYKYNKANEWHKIECKNDLPWEEGRYKFRDKEGEIEEICILWDDNDDCNICWEYYDAWKEIKFPKKDGGIRMTDEEMAEQYANQSCFTEMPNPSLSESVDISDDIKQAYLAGLKAGKDMNVATKWHKVADGDYPKKRI